MNVQHIHRDGLCMQCGTCEALCPRGAVRMVWDVREGYRPQVSSELCTDCGTCLRACPGPGFDFAAGAWWRERNEGAPFRDFLGPWRSLWFGWASDPRVRHAGASGGVATAILIGALETGFADAVLAVGTDPDNPLAAVGAVCHTPGEVAACRGSKYNAAAVNTKLRTVREEDGRYVLVGLPCHIQGLRLAQRHSRKLRARVVLALGIFCGLTNEPRATEVAARQAGLDPSELSSVAYRGPGWPGGMRLATRDGSVRSRGYPAYCDRYFMALVPPRCRICPDALAEAADISVGDAWLDRFEGSDGVSDIVVRTPAGERLLADLAGRLTLSEATAEDMLASQRDTYRVKRDLCRGRLWMRERSRRPVPDYPGLDLLPTRHERLLGALDAGRERLFRFLVDRRWPAPA